MQIILLEKVANLGNLGDVVKVKDGYARNFLIPSRMARRATETAIKEFEAKRAELEKAAAEKLATAQAFGEKLAGKTVRITQKAGVDGRLFGSVTNADIAEALTKNGLRSRQVAGPPAQRPAEDRRRARRRRRRRTPTSSSTSPCRWSPSKTKVFSRAPCPPAASKGPTRVGPFSLAHALSRVVPRFPRAIHKLCTQAVTQSTGSVHFAAQRFDRKNRRFMTTIFDSALPSRGESRDDEVAKPARPAAIHRGRTERARRPAARQRRLGSRGRRRDRGDFYRFEHKLIFGAIGALIDASKPADVITVYEQLQMARQGRGVRVASHTSTRSRRACRARPTCAATRRSCASARSCAS